MVGGDRWDWKQVVGGETIKLQALSGGESDKGQGLGQTGTIGDRQQREQLVEGVGDRQYRHWGGRHSAQALGGVTGGRWKAAKGPSGGGEDRLQGAGVRPLDFLLPATPVLALCCTCSRRQDAFKMTPQKSDSRRGK